MITYYIMSFSMDQIVKYQAMESGPFTRNNNIVHFDVPNDGVYDLMNSYVEFNSEVVVDGNDNAVYNMQLVDSNNRERCLYNVSLVKNCNMVSSKYGRLEDIREVRTLRSTLNEYTLSTSEKNSLEYASINQKADASRLSYSLFTELYCLGNTQSKYKNFPIRVKLSQLFNLGRVRQFPSSVMGRTRITIELGLDNIDVEQILSFQTQQNNEVLCEDVVNVTNPTTLTTSGKYYKEEDIPFYTGQYLQISASPEHDEKINGKKRIIKSIEWVSSGADKYKVKLTFTEKLNDTSGDVDSEDIGLKIVPWTSAEFKVNFAEIVLRKVGNPGPLPSVFEYETYTVEEFNGNQSTSLSRMFQVENNCKNLYIMFPNNLYSINRNIDKFRLRVNNEDLTDRDVHVQSATRDNRDPLYYDRIAMSLSSSGLKLKNLLESVPNNTAKDSSSDIYQDRNNRLLLVCNPLQLSDREKLLQVNIDSGTSTNGVERMILYKEVRRVIEF